MKERWQLEAAVIGGDSRQLAVARSLADWFDQVYVVGHPESQIQTPLQWRAEVSGALAKAQVVVLPIAGMNDSGMIRGYPDQPPLDFKPYLEQLSPNTLLVAGSLTKQWRKVAAEHRIHVVEYAEDDEIAILNSIPTAEGAIQIAMEEMPITIHGSTVLVVGFGRVGITVARSFKALGARVIVTARRAALLARAVEMGCEVVGEECLSQSIGAADLIINSVPALVIDAALLGRTRPDVFIIDLASPPGGIDFEAVAALKIKAKLYPGLPGIVAPKTAGAILASSIPKLIQKFFLENGGVINNAV